MKILKDTLNIVEGTWDDPGDYPSNAGSGPLPSFRCVDSIEGEVEILLEGEEEIEDMLENVETPYNIKVLKWNISIEGKKITASVEEFDESSGDFDLDINGEDLDIYD